MKYIYLPIIFVIAFFISTAVLWQIMLPIAEYLRTMELDSTVDPPAYFPLLIKSSTSDAPYRITYFKDLSPNDVIVTDIEESSIPSINEQIGNRTNIPFGKILSLSRGDGFTDLWLEARNPEWVRGWSRIEDRKFIPQKYHMYTRGIAYGFGPFVLIGGIILASAAVSLVNKKVEQRAANRPADAVD